MTNLRFAKIGAALFGPSWRSALAEAIDVAERTVRRWETGESAIPDGIPADLAKLCRAHSDKLAKIADQIDGGGK